MLKPITITRKPHQEFEGLIEKFWLMPKTGGGGQTFLESLPDGNFDLVFVLGEHECRALYVGPFTELRYIPIFNQYDYFCVWFRPGIMPRMADVEAADLVNTWATLTRILGRSSDEIGERLVSARGIDAKQRVIEEIFRKADILSRLPEEKMLRCFHAVESLRGAVRVAELAEQAGISPRTLERMFREQTGLSPKTFIRMVRFQHALARLKSGGNHASLAHLACECGYADQSHFIRDFKMLAQRLPGSY